MSDITLSAALIGFFGVGLMEPRLFVLLLTFASLIAVFVGLYRLALHVRRKPAPVVPLRRPSGPPRLVSYTCPRCSCSAVEEVYTLPVVCTLCQNPVPFREYVAKRGA